MPRVAAALLLAIVILSACSQDNDSTSSTTAPDDATGRSGEPEATTTVVASLDDQPLEEAERACVEEELGPDVDPNQIPTDQLDDAVGACARSGTFAAGFTDALAQDNPGLYSDADLDCLAEQYGQLTNEDVQLLVQAGLNPQAPPPEADQILNDLFGACGVARPPG